MTMKSQNTYVMSLVASTFVLCLRLANNSSITEKALQPKPSICNGSLSWLPASFHIGVSRPVKLLWTEFCCFPLAVTALGHSFVHDHEVAECIIRKFCCSHTCSIRGNGPCLPLTSCKAIGGNVSLSRRRCPASAIAQCLKRSVQSKQCLCA